MTDKVNC